MSYCIMRMAKVKSRASLFRAAQHNTRERQPLNADEARTGQNEITGPAADVMKTYTSQFPKKVRKNAVHAIELVFTASPDFAGDWDSYLQGCSKWAAGLFGEKNVLHVARHSDEMTPHAHVLVMPLHEEKLNANYFVGGSRDRMAELQDDFYKKVGQQYGLDRGQSKAETKARHTHHTLAAAAAELDEIKHDLVGKTFKLNEREKTLTNKAEELDEREKEMDARSARLKTAEETFTVMMEKSPDYIKSILVEPEKMRLLADTRERRIFENEKQIRQKREQSQGRRR